MIFLGLKSQVLLKLASGKEHWFEWSRDLTKIYQNFLKTKSALFFSILHFRDHVDTYTIY